MAEALTHSWTAQPETHLRCARAVPAVRRLSKRGHVAQDCAVQRVTGLFPCDLAKFNIKFINCLKLDTESHSAHFTLF